jgi:hypothetical protein
MSIEDTFDENALVCDYGAEHCESGRVKFCLYSDLWNNAALDGDRAIVSLERHVAARHQYRHEHCEHADGISHSEHPESRKLSSPAQD